MIRGALGFAVIMVFFCVPVAAQASYSPPWSWNTFIGTSYWDVWVTEDESRCTGGEITRDLVPITITHNAEHAEMGNVGHGSAEGRFISNNILHMPGRIVNEQGGGSSTLSAYDIFFATDCSAFAGQYNWTYYGPGGYSCSGSTALSGFSSKGCPEVPAIPTVAAGTKESFGAELAGARTDLNKDLVLRYIQKETDNLLFEYDRPGSTALSASQIEEAKALRADATGNIRQLEPTIEAKYTAILDRDSGNFWANWDMAELKKAQGNYEEFFRYNDKALTNRDIARATEQEIKDNVAAGLGLTEYPTTQNSYFIRRMSTDAAAIQNVYGIDVKKGDPDTERVRMFAFWNMPYETVNIVGLPGS